VCFSPGSTPYESARALVQHADRYVTNFSELVATVRTAGLAVEADDEDAPQARGEAAGLLCARDDALFGRASVCVCTLGRHGLVLATRDAVHSIEVRVPPGCEVPTRSGAGDRWFGLWTLYEELFARGGLVPNPSLAAAVRATHEVAGWLGLKLGSYEVISTEFGVPERKRNARARPTLSGHLHSNAA